MSHVDARALTPTVHSISFDNSPVRRDRYELGETIQVTVRFDRAVAVTGTLQAALAIGRHTRQAILYAWTLDGRGLYFFYTVQTDDRDADGISIPANALSLRSGTVKDASDGTIDAVLTHQAVPTDAHRKVNGSRVRSPRVRSISYTHGPDPVRGDTYQRGERIQLLVEFDRAVTVTGLPQMALSIGTETRQASFFPISFLDLGSSVYFSYTVQAADRDADGISIAANALSLHGGAIRLAGDDATDAVLTHPAVAAGPDRKVDGSRVAARR